MVRILAVSDEETIRDEKMRIPQDLQDSIDILLSCGDLSPYYLEYLVDRFFPRPALMVLGNHDESFFTVSKQVPSEGYSPLYRGLYSILDSTFILSSSENKQLTSDIVVGGFSGAMAYGKRPFFFTEKNAKKFVTKLRYQNMFKNNDLDIMMSHTPPQIDNLIEMVDTFHKPSEELGKLLNYFSPKIWLYGHIHPRYTSAKLDFEFNGTHIINCVPYKIIDYDESAKKVLSVSHKM